MQMCYIFVLEITNILAVGFSRDRRRKLRNFWQPYWRGDNSVSNHSQPYDKDNILHSLFSLWKDCENAKELLC